VFTCSSDDDYIHLFNHLFYHGLVSYQMFKKWTHHDCYTTHTETCDHILTESKKQLGRSVQEPAPSDKNFPSLDPDDLYQDFCRDNGTLEFSIDNPNTCNKLGTRTTNYLNRPDVQEAIHAKPLEWLACANLNYTSNAGSMNPYYESFFALNPTPRILVASGDIDIDTVPFPFTMACLDKLNRPVTSAWQPWFVNGATSGYVEQYDKYTYITVKGAGHEIPYYQPLLSFSVFQRYITNSSFVEDSESAPAPFLPKLKQGLVLREFMRVNEKNWLPFELLTIWVAIECILQLLSFNFSFVKQNKTK